MSKMIRIGEGRLPWQTSGGVQRERGRGVVQLHHEPTASGRLAHDSADGPAVNPGRRRCERCGRKTKHCKCGRERR